MQKWEYTSLYIRWNSKAKAWQFEYAGRTYPANERNTIMNALGEEGWELVSTISFEGTNTGFGYPAPSNRVFTEAYLLFFKRPKE
jgi:Domain of unknown function (DUF4177)